MKKRKRIIAVIMLPVILFILLCIYIFSVFHAYSGEYESVDSKESSYSLSISDSGTFSISDIGAGNPVMKGRLIKVPLKSDRFFMSCLGDPDFDPVFLNVGKKVRTLDIYFSLIGNMDKGSYRTVVFENGREHIQFNEER